MTTLHFNPAKLIAAREAKGLSQADLSRLLDWPRQRVCELEAGAVKDPTASRVAALARALGVKMERLMG
jgi:transcriptional regulator with XRE-family HTH domain